MRVVYASGASRDLADIVAFGIETWGEPVAKDYAGKMLTAFSRLADHPRLGATAERLRAGFRKLSVGSHIGYYTFTADAVTIHRILHASQEPTLHLR